MLSKNHLKLYRDGPMHVFRLMDFPVFALQWEVQLIISEILGYYNQGWSRNHFKFFLLIYMLKELPMLWRFYMNITDWIGVTGYWSEIISIISHKNNIVFVKLFEMSFGSNILASFTEF